MSDLKRKALEMRNAIDMIEGALMGLGNFVDLPGIFEDARDDLVITPTFTVGEVRRVCRELVECTRIVNDEDFDPEKLR